MCDTKILTDQRIIHNIPVITIHDPKKRMCKLRHIDIPTDINVKVQARLKVVVDGRD